MGSTPSKRKQSPRPLPPLPPPPRSIMRDPRRGPVPGHPGTYADFQEQMFTTNNFAPYRSRNTVNFHDDLGIRTPASRPKRRSQPIQQVSSAQSDGNAFQENTQPTSRVRADVLSPPTNIPRQPGARPPRDWNELWADEMMYYDRYRMYDAPYQPYYAPMRRYDYEPNSRYQMRQNPYNSGFMFNPYMPYRRQNYFGPQYFPDMQRRPFPNISGYRQPNIPQLPLDQQQQQQQQSPPQQIPNQASVLQRYAQESPLQANAPVQQQQQPAIPQAVQSFGSQQSQNTNEYIQSVQTNPVTSYRSYEIEDIPKPMFDDGSERASILSHVEDQYLTSGEMKSQQPKLQVIMMDDDDEYIGSNLRFYRNEIKYRPDGEYIDNIHKYWMCQYEKLANTPTYMPWLFPLTKRSRVNPFAEPLKKHEARHIFNDDEARERYLTSYKMMLDFFGLELVSEKTGEVKRSRNWRDRFQHLRRSKRSHERITRILQSLGLLGYPHFQAPLILYLYHETIETKELSSIPFPALKGWHRCISNVYDSNYVVDQFTKMTQRQKMNTIVEVKDTYERRASEQPRMIKYIENDDQTSRFQSNRDIPDTGNHDSKQDRLTYRDDDDDNKPDTTLRNEFPPATPLNDEQEVTVAKQQYYEAPVAPTEYLQPPEYSEKDPYRYKNTTEF